LANGILTLADNYTIALKAAPFLSAIVAPAVHMPVAPTVPFGIGEWAGIAYHILEHQYELIVYQ